MYVYMQIYVCVSVIARRFLCVDFSREIQRITTDMADGEASGDALASEIQKLVSTAGSTALEATTEAVLRDLGGSGVIPDETRMKEIERELKIKKAQIEKMGAQTNRARLGEKQKAAQQAQQKEYINNAVTAIQKLISDPKIFSSDSMRQHAADMLDAAFEPITEKAVFSVEPVVEPQTGKKHDHLDTCRDILKALRPRANGKTKRDR